jgi:hypothetical protein
MQIIISGIDRTNRFRSGSLEIEDTINERSMARLQIVDTSMTLELQDGQQIQIYDDYSTLIFAGFLLYPKKHVPVTKNAWYYDLEATDNHQIADRWLVAKTYINTVVSDIVSDLYTSYLQQDGITIGNIATTAVTLDKASFPRVGTVTDALNELCDITGFNWYIDYDKKFYFIPRSFFLAPFNITTTSSINNVQVRQDRSQYRNRQYIRGGQIQTDEIALEKPTPNPDGVSRVFITRFPISDKPRIFINSVEITATDIGINGVDKNKKYYYDVGKNTIVQDATQTVLSSSDVIQVTYKGLISLAVVSEDPLAIAGRASLEGNTGVYERIDVDTSIVSRGEAISIANGKLTKYTKVARQITYDTYTAGLAAGQLQTITLPEYNISSTDFLIDKVQISELDGAGRLVYTVHAIDGDPLGGWQKFYNDLLKQDLKASIRENELLVILTTTAEAEGWTETVTQTVQACFVPSELLYPSNTLIPCGLPANFMLDSVAALPSAAYSLRRLKTTYTGNAIRVRRSSDNAELDIGFTGQGDLDTASLLTHVGVGNGFVTTWYDQSGNGRNATKTTSTAQPRIVSSGAVVTENGRPYIDFKENFGLVAENYNTTLSFSLALLRSETAVFSHFHTICDGIAPLRGGGILQWGNTTFHDNPFPSGVWKNGTPLTIPFDLAPITSPLQVSIQYLSPLETRPKICIGNYDEGAFGGAVRQPEIIVFSSAISTADRQALERNQGEYYGISLV